MFTETATLCLDSDNKNNTEPATMLLTSLLDILLGMLTHTSSIVRQALQVSPPGPACSASVVSSGYLLLAWLCFLKECLL